MTTYRLLNDVNNCHEAFIDFKSFRRQFNELKVWFPQENARLLEKLKKTWVPVAVTFSSDKTHNIVPDISVWNLSCLVLSSKAEALLRPLLATEGELLALEQGFYLFNCLHSIGSKAVDAKCTSMQIEFAEGASTPKALALISEQIAGITIFKPGFLDNGFLMCQDELKSLIVSNNLSGITFEENLAQIFSAGG